MRSRWLLLLFLCASLSAVLMIAAFFWLTPSFMNTEYVGGKYKSSIQITGQDPSGFQTGRIFYTKDGVTHRGYWGADMREALNWIKNNTPTDAVFLNWWDYGHMIVG